MKLRLLGVKVEKFGVLAEIPLSEVMSALSISSLGMAVMLIGTSCTSSGRF